MNTDRLFQVLSSIHPVSESLRKAIQQELTALSLPKNHHLLEAPKIADQAYFIDAGFVLSYSFLQGKKQIEGFWAAGQILILSKSFFEQVPSREFIQLMEPGDIYCVSYAGVMRLFDAFPETHRMYRVVMNQYYENSRERILDMQGLTATERYRKLIATYPRIEQIIPQEYIASYLGITPQSLSRIKRRQR